MSTTKNQIQLDEFYLDLQTDGRKISMLSTERIINAPFPGLRPFKTSEHQLFFGRDGQADKLIEKLKTNRFMAVIGSSGSGKSSLVRAGLIPHLFSGYLYDAGFDWNIAIMRPGSNPIRNLAISISNIHDYREKAGDLKKSVAELESLLKENPYALLEIEETMTKMTGKPFNLAVIVDQFEELFRYKQERKKSGHDNSASQFTNLLLKASAQKNSNVYVILTMRSEYLGECVQFRDLPEAINRGQYLVPRLKRSEIKEVIESPLKQIDKEISPILVNSLLSEVGDNMDQLPILQHALMRTYNANIARKGNELNMDDYESIGKMKKSLAMHAEEKFAQLADKNSGEEHYSKKQKIAKTIFQCLTDKSSDDRGIRRPMLFKDIAYICKEVNATEDEVKEVVNHFRGEFTSFLMPPLNSALHDELIIDISHESLMRNWEVLSNWIHEEVEQGKLYKSLNERRLLHEEKKYDFIKGSLLDELISWKNDFPVNHVWAKRYHGYIDTGREFNSDEEIYKANLDFLNYSERKSIEEIAEKENKERAELKREQREKFKNYLNWGFALGILLAISLTIWALNEKHTAALALDRVQLQKFSWFNNLPEGNVQNEVVEDYHDLKNSPKKWQAYQSQIALASSLYDYRNENLTKALALLYHYSERCEEENIVDLYKVLRNSSRPYEARISIDSVLKEVNGHSLVNAVFLDTMALFLADSGAIHYDFERKDLNGSTNRRNPFKLKENEEILLSYIPDGSGVLSYNKVLNSIAIQTNVRTTYENVDIRGNKINKELAFLESEKEDFANKLEMFEHRWQDSQELFLLEQCAALEYKIKIVENKINELEWYVEDFKNKILAIISPAGDFIIHTTLSNTFGFLEKVGDEYVPIPCTQDVPKDLISIRFISEQEVFYESMKSFYLYKIEIEESEKGERIAKVTLIDERQRNNGLNEALLLSGRDTLENTAYWKTLNQKVDSALFRVLAFHPTKNLVLIVDESELIYLQSDEEEFGGQKVLKVIDLDSQQSIDFGWHTELIEYASFSPGNLVLTTDHEHSYIWSSKISNSPEIENNDWILNISREEKASILREQGYNLYSSGSDYFAKGDTIAATFDWKESILFYEDSYSIDSSVTALQSMGYLYKELKEWDKALEYFQQTLMYFPTSTHYVEEVHDLFLQKGDTLNRNYYSACLGCLDDDADKAIRILSSFEDSGLDEEMRLRLTGDSCFIQNEKVFGSEIYQKLIKKKNFGKPS